MRAGGGIILGPSCSMAEAVAAMKADGWPARKAYCLVRYGKMRGTGYEAPFHLEGSRLTATDVPYIVRYEGTNGVIVHSADCREALRWLRDCVFTGAVAYVCSDFEGNHTFEVAALAAPVVPNA